MPPIPAVNSNTGQVVSRQGGGMNPLSMLGGGGGMMPSLSGGTSSAKGGTVAGGSTLSTGSFAVGRNPTADTTTPEQAGRGGIMPAGGLPLVLGAAILGVAWIAGRS